VVKRRGGQQQQMQRGGGRDEGGGGPGVRCVADGGKADPDGAGDRGGPPEPGPAGVADDQQGGDRDDEQIGKQTDVSLVATRAGVTKAPIMPMAAASWP
jgi:hypothetical protein